MKFKTLEELTLEYFTMVWNYYNGQKTKVAESLGISKKTAYNYKVKCEKLGYNLTSSKTRRVLDDSGFPTNEARLRYIDEMINRDKL